MADDAIRIAEIESRIAQARDASALDAIEQEFFGRKHGLLTIALRALSELPSDDRRRKGQELNALKKCIERTLTQRRQELRLAAGNRLKESDPLDLTIDLPAHPRGGLHPIPQFLQEVSEVFGRMGFDIAEGPERESEELNFTLVNMPSEHPARDAQDTFWVEEPTGTMLLRTHTTPVQIRYMRTHEPPFRMICPGRVYRRDADATHAPMFHQFEGLMVGSDISLGHMKGVMSAAIRELLGKDIRYRFRTSYFPFVEPGLEMDIQWASSGDDAASGARWLEVVGCGMVHPQVLKNGGVDPDRWQGFAFGFGVERLVMLRHGITDLRCFAENDLRFLTQF